MAVGQRRNHLLQNAIVLSITQTRPRRRAGGHIVKMHSDAGDNAGILPRKLHNDFWENRGRKQLCTSNPHFPHRRDGRCAADRRNRRSPCHAPRRRRSAVGARLFQQHRSKRAVKTCPQRRQLSPKAAMAAIPKIAPLPASALCCRLCPCRWEHAAHVLTRRLRQVHRRGTEKWAKVIRGANIRVE
jgi:hypothetical protein